MTIKQSFFLATISGTGALLGLCIIKAGIQTSEDHKAHRERLKRWEKEGFKPSTNMGMLKAISNTYWPLFPLKKQDKTNNSSVENLETDLPSNRSAKKG